MRALLAGLALIFNAADNLTTYACLRDPLPGVYEANPIAAWGFGVLGLEVALVVEMALCLLAVGFLVSSSLLPARLRAGLLVLLAVLPAGAVINNLTVMRELGIPWY